MSKIFAVLINVMTLWFIFLWYDVGWLYNLVIFYWWFLCSMFFVFAFFYFVSNDVEKAYKEQVQAKPSNYWHTWVIFINSIIAAFFVAIGHPVLAAYILVATIVAKGIRTNALDD